MSAPEPVIKKKHREKRAEYHAGKHIFFSPCAKKAKNKKRHKKNKPDRAKLDKDKDRHHMHRLKITDEVSALRKMSLSKRREIPAADTK